jgi:uridine kinase
MTSKLNLAQVRSALVKKVGGTAFIAVDGHGGSGKSTLSQLLSENLEARVIRTDDFANWDNPFDWWPLVIERIFEPIANGATTLSYPRSKWWDNHYPEPVSELPVTPVMILEGVSSSRKEFQDYLSFSIFVDTPRAVCLARGVERDLSTGKPREELERMWQKWWADEEEFFKRDGTKERANILLDGTRPFEIV